MKDILGRVGITEFFTLIGPGIFLLLSLALWLPPDALGKLLVEGAKSLDSIALALVAALVAYTLGQVVSVVAIQSTLFRDYYSTFTDREKRRVFGLFYSGLLWLLQGTFDRALTDPNNVQSLLILVKR